VTVRFGYEHATVFVADPANDHLKVNASLKMALLTK
jgi:hypothetical protein